MLFLLRSALYFPHALCPLRASGSDASQSQRRPVLCPSYRRAGIPGLPTKHGSRHFPLKEGSWQPGYHSSCSCRETLAGLGGTRIPRGGRLHGRLGTRACLFLLLPLPCEARNVRAASPSLPGAAGRPLLPPPLLLHSTHCPTRHPNRPDEGTLSSQPRQTRGHERRAASCDVTVLCLWVTVSVGDSARASPGGVGSRICSALGSSNHGLQDGRKQTPAPYRGGRRMGRVEQLSGMSFLSTEIKSTETLILYEQSYCF